MLPAPGTYLDIREAHERIGRALVHQIALAHQSPLRTLSDGSAIATAADLASIPDNVLDTNEDAAPVLAQVGPTLNIWAWFRFLVRDTGPTCVRPDSVAVDAPGRWVLQTLPDPACCESLRYLAHVEYCADQVTEAMLWDRCRGKTPALFVSPTDDALDEESQTQAFHYLKAGYRIRVLSANWRGGVAARFTAPRPEEAAEDPGTQRILGDVRRLLIHDLTLQNTLGVVKPILGSMRPIKQLDAERVLVDAMNVSIVAYTWTPNTACELVPGWRMWVQMQDRLGVSALPEFNIKDPVRSA